QRAPKASQRLERPESANLGATDNRRGPCGRRLARDGTPGRPWTERERRRDESCRRAAVWHLVPVRHHWWGTDVQPGIGARLKQHDGSALGRDEAGQRDHRHVAGGPTAALWPPA